MSKDCVKAYAVKVSFGVSIFGAMSALDKVLPLINKENLLGINPQPDGVLILFSTLNDARNQRSKFVCSGVKAKVIETPCMVEKRYLNEEYQGKRKKLEDSLVGDDLEYIQKVRKCATEVEKSNAEKRELRREVGETSARLERVEQELEAKKQQVTMLIENNEKMIREKDEIIGRLERRVKELEEELDNVGVVRRVIGLI